MGNEGCSDREESKKDLAASPQSSMWTNIIASASAGIIARGVCHPIDTLKSRFQSKSYESYRSVLSVLQDTWHSEGSRGLYRGFAVAAVGGIPGTCSYLMTYDKSKSFLSQNTSLSPFSTYFISGMLAETVCCLWFVPVDVIKERLQIQRSSQSKNFDSKVASNPAMDKYIYRGSIDAFRKIIKAEGLRGIYKGYVASIMSFGPFSALYFVFLEEAKVRISAFRERELGNSKGSISNSNSNISNSSNNSNNSNNSRGNISLSFIDTLLATAVAGGIASFATSPLDLVKLRLQVQGMPTPPTTTTTTASPPVSSSSSSSSTAAPTTEPTRSLPQYNRNASGFARLFRDIYSKQGLRGIFRGSLTRVLFHAPNTAITLTAYEQIKKAIDL